MPTAKPLGPTPFTLNPFQPKETTLGKAFGCHALVLGADFGYEEFLGPGWPRYC